MYRFCCLLLASTLASSLSAAPPKDKAKESPFAEAHTRWQKGNYEESREAWQKLLAQDRYFVPATVGLVRVALSEGENDRAYALLADALKKAPDEVEFLAHRAELDYLVGQWDAAKATVEAILKSKPEHFLARWVRAQILRDSGDLKAAEVEMRWFVKTYTARSNDDKDITDPEELLLVGQAGSENARWNGLTDQFRFILSDIYGDILKDDPNCWRAEFLSGVMLLEKYNRPEAQDAFSNALKINPRCAEAMVGRGSIAIQGFNLREAETFADQALKANPNLTMALRLKADVHLGGGEPAKAMVLLEKARKLRPREEETLARLAACFQLMQKPARVDELLKEVEGFNAKPALFCYELGNAFEDRRLYADADKWYRKSIALRDNLPAPRAALGLLQLRLAQEKEGRELLTKAFEKDKFNVRVANSLKVLRHLDKYETIKTAHFEIRYDPKTDKVLAETIADDLEDIYATLSKEFAFEPKEPWLFELFNNHEMFSGRTTALPDLHTIGACIGKVVTMVSPQGKGLAKMFNWNRVIRHEVVHLFNLAQTEYQVPHWLTEGLAVRNEGGMKPPMWQTLLRERRDANELLTLDNIQLSFVKPKNQMEWNLAYCQANMYVEYSISRFGLPTIGKMLDAYREGLSDERVVVKTCNVPKADFEKGYKEYVENYLKSISTVARKELKPMKLEELQEANKAKPEDDDVASQLASEYLRRRNPADARKLVDGVLRRTPGNALAATIKARLLTQAGEEEAALTLLETALKTSPDEPRLLGALAKIHLDSKEYKRAADLAERGWKLSPIDGNWLETLSVAYEKLGDTPKQASVLARMCDLDTDDFESRFKLAKLWQAAMKYPESEAAALECMHIDITHAESRAIFLQALEKQDKKELLAKWKKRFGG